MNPMSRRAHSFFSVGGIIRDMQVTMMKRTATLLLVLTLTTLSSTSLAFVPLTLPRQVPFTYVRYLSVQNKHHYTFQCFLYDTHSINHSSLLFSVLHSQKVEETNDNSAIPPNLRRKVRAKRPPRGHVIPRSQKVKGVGGSSNPRLRPQGKAREAGLNNPSNIKIIGGSARGRRLDSPQVYLRPMMAKVKEALFSTLTSFGMYDNGMATRHLDIFAGSGSVGIGIAESRRHALHVCRRFARLLCRHGTQCAVVSIFGKGSNTNCLCRLFNGIARTIIRWNINHRAVRYHYPVTAVRGSGVRGIARSGSQFTTRG